MVSGYQWFPFRGGQFLLSDMVSCPFLISHTLNSSVVIDSSGLVLQGVPIVLHRWLIVYIRVFGNAPSRRSEVFLRRDD